MEKTIIRTSKRENPYAVIDKTFLNDTNLSWKAKGLMAFLLSKPDDWQIMVSNLVQQAPDGRDAVYATIKELIQCGYIVKKKIRDEKGRFLGFEYIVHEVPQEPDLYLGKKDTEVESSVENKGNDIEKTSLNPLPVLPNFYEIPQEPYLNLEKKDKNIEIDSGVENRGHDIEKTSLNPFPDYPDTDYPDTASPDTGFPDTVCPYPENPTLLSNDLLLNNDLTKNPPYPPNQKPEGEGVKISPEEVQILEPMGKVLFGQYNLQIACKLKDQVREFEINEVCIQECLKNIDAGKIQFNPYAYFRIQYMMAIVAVAKRKRQQAVIQTEERTMQESEPPSAEYMINKFRQLREQLTKT